jgi:hypothetical protein
MAGLRHALAWALVAALMLLLPRVSRAQGCHVPQPQAGSEQGFRLALAQETTRFRSPRYEGHYQGLLARGSVTHRWLYAGIGVAAYRIVRNGLTRRGFGDLLIHSQARLLSTHDDSFAGGLVLGATLPTGDARADLGMGHWMVTTGAWSTANVKPLLVGAQITYAQSLTSAPARHHHQSAGPLVAPMAASEVDATLFASLPLGARWPDLRVKAGTNFAEPVAGDGSTTRADAFVAFLRTGRAATSIELHVPLVGDPSEQRLMIELSVLVP